MFSLYITEISAIEAQPINAAGLKKATDQGHDSPAAGVKVELYVTDWCPYCKKAINFFTSKGITPQIFNIEKDPIALKRKNLLDPEPGVPFAVIDGTPVHGFSESYYQLILNQDL